MLALLRLTLLGNYRIQAAAPTPTSREDPEQEAPERQKGSKPAADFEQMKSSYQSLSSIKSKTYFSYRIMREMEQ